MLPIEAESVSPIENIGHLKMRPYPAWQNGHLYVDNSYTIFIFKSVCIGLYFIWDIVH